MSSTKKQSKTSGHRVRNTVRRVLLPIAVSLLSMIVVIAVLWLWKGDAASDFERLQGRWFRTDGGYVIEIHEVADDGTMVAGYFNPQPIHVSQANASREEDRTLVTVELRDVNYPGSTYILEYDRDRDMLEGFYYQAKLQQKFDVRFVRIQ
jgi:hypothetical protein